MQLTSLGEDSKRGTVWQRGREAVGGSR